MAVGLAILTAYGSTTIDRLSTEIYATADAYLQFIPENLQDRPLRDPLVVEALESWASREAASIMVGLFLVAAGVTAAAVVRPSLSVAAQRRSRARMLTAASPTRPSARAPAGIRRDAEHPSPTSSSDSSALDRRAAELTARATPGRPPRRRRASGSWPSATAS